MDDRRLERIELKIDDQAATLSEINVTLASQHVSLTEHMRRTSILENKLAPVERHVAMVNGALKLIGILGVLAAIYQVFKR